MKGGPQVEEIQLFRESIKFTVTKELVGAVDITHEAEPDFEGISSHSVV